MATTNPTRSSRVVRARARRPHDSDEILIIIYYMRVTYPVTRLTTFYTAYNFTEIRRKECRAVRAQPWCTAGRARHTGLFPLPSTPLRCRPLFLNVFGPADGPTRESRLRSFFILIFFFIYHCIHNYDRIIILYAARETIVRPSVRLSFD